MTDAPIRSVLDEDHGSLRPSASVPTQGVTASGDDVVVWRKSAEVKPEPGTKFVALYEDGSGAWLGFAHDGGFIDSDGDDWEKMRNAEWWAYLPSGFRLCCENHPDADWALTLPDHVCPPVENSHSPALGGMEGEARNAQEPLSGSQAAPSASTTNIRGLPDTAGEVEPVAWRGQVVAGGVWNFRGYEMPVGDLWDAVEPLYSQATVEALQKREAGLRAAMRDACDLLAERVQGSRARSPGHNARLLLEQALGDQT